MTAEKKMMVAVALAVASEEDWALVVARCCPWSAGYRPLSDGEYARAWSLADGFGACSARDAARFGFYGDWSHFRDSTDAASKSVATYLRTLES